MFYFTIETQEFLWANDIEQSQYGHHLSPYKYLFCIHEKSISGITVSIAAQILPLRCCRSLYIFRVHRVLDVPPVEKIKNSWIRVSVPAYLPDAFGLQTPSVSLNCSNQRRMFTCGRLLRNSFLNLRWSFTNAFVSANHKPHCPSF
jgi:hypothetical protein